MNASWLGDQEDQLQEGPQGVTSGPLPNHGNLFPCSLFSLLSSRKSIRRQTGSLTRTRSVGGGSIEARQGVDGGRQSIPVYF